MADNIILQMKNRPVFFDFLARNMENERFRLFMFYTKISRDHAGSKQNDWSLLAPCSSIQFRGTNRKMGGCVCVCEGVNTQSLLAYKECTTNYTMGIPRWHCKICCIYITALDLYFLLFEKCFHANTQERNIFETKTRVICKISKIPQRHKTVYLFQYI